ncbi:lactadherin-like [Saccostrea echinata]|uniref:lactadherin-like n=1 Tax=Saccostrea echinata TaxID=191078 RepID=UPI002A8406B7|nr:lactadherin-like [Saccostrea echinata]
MAYACDSHLVKNVADDKLTASSIFSKKYPAFKARLSNAEGWSPLPSQKNPWIQVDFGREMMIIAVLTKGMGGLREWVKKFQVKYSNTNLSWTIVQNGSSNEFNANTDSTSLVRNELPFEVKSRYLRLYPMDCHNYCSLRFDFIGCEVTKSETEITSSITPTAAKTTTTKAATAIAATVSTTTSTDEVDKVTATSTQFLTSTHSPDSSTIMSTSHCPCECVNEHHSTLTKAELRARLVGIVQNLTVSKKTTSFYKRSKISAQDNRPQVLYVGSIGIAILFIIVNLIVLPDLFKLFHYLYQMRNL